MKLIRNCSDLNAGINKIHKKNIFTGGFGQLTLRVKPFSMDRHSNLAQGWRGTVQSLRAWFGLGNRVLVLAILISN